MSMRLFLASLVTCLPLFTACDLLLGSGDECSADSDCSGDDICDGGECVECENDRDCDDNEECNDGECERAGNEGEGEGDAGEGEGEGEGGEGEGEGEATEGEPCNADTFSANCSGDVIQLCAPEDAGGADVVRNINCSTEFYQGGDGNPITEPTITCVEPAALGSVPGPARAQCWGEGAGAVCQGNLGLMGNADALLIGCDAGFSCTLNATGEACASSPITCTETSTSCSGDQLIFCAFGDETFTYADPLVTDCTLLGGTCQSDGTNAACVVATDGICSVAGILAQCDTGLTCTPDAAAPGLGNCTGG